ncbi:MAG TPA: site-specific integrase [Gaiellaceae bacterium]|nr:site-specific integrase [Gaiellaceae bacterium]
MLGGMLGYAVRRGHATTNVVRQLERDERPTHTQREGRVLDANEIQPFIDATPTLYRAIIVTAIFTGLRQGELLGLKWCDVELERGIVRVRRQLDRFGTLAEPKTRQSLREVVLMPSLASLLRRHRQASRYAGADDFVFASLTGGPWYYRNVVRRGFDKAKAVCGTDDGHGTTLVFHDLRRTFGSLLIAQGCDVVYVSRQMGHSSVGVTLGVYAKEFDAQRHGAETASKLEAAFGGSPGW